jgi:hypothetical protein
MLCAGYFGTGRGRISPYRAGSELLEADRSTIWCHRFSNYRLVARLVRLGANLVKAHRELEQRQVGFHRYVCGSTLAYISALYGSASGQVVIFAHKIWLPTAASTLGES